MQTPTMGVTGAETGSARPTSAPGNAFAAQSEFDTFLKMLTTQIQNQDPLNPMEATDFATQLATFSGVEQQVKTNEHLRNLGTGGALGGLAAHADWVGMSARVDGTVAFEGSERLLHFDLPPDSARASLVVSTPDGQEIRRRDISGQDSPYVWDGRTASGEPLLAGTYKLTIESLDAAGRTSTSPVATYARIAEVRAGSQGPELLLEDGRTVAPAEVSALRMD